MYMSKEETFRHIFSCVSFKHMFDLSPRITDSAQKKEDLLFSSAVFFLRELSKNKNIFDVAKGLKEFVKDYPATSLRYLANEKYVEQLTKAKELIEELSSSLSVVGECEEEECELLNRAEQFLKDSIE